MKWEVVQAGGGKARKMHLAPIGRRAYCGVETRFPNLFWGHGPAKSAAGLQAFLKNSTPDDVCSVCVAQAKAERAVR